VLDRAEKIPTSAIMTSRQLVAASVKSQRDALAPLVDSATPPGRLLPAGSALALVPMTWHQSGNFANAMADIHIPGEAQQKYELGFVRLSGSWRVTFIQGSS